MSSLPIFSVVPEVFERWPDYIVGCVQVTGVRNDVAAPEIETALVEAEALIRSQFAELDPKEHQNIAIWRNVFAECAWTPSKYLSSIEAIVRRVSRGQQLPRIGPIVDLANACSLRHVVPIGAHDTSTLGRPLQVRVATANDAFLPMGDAPQESPDLGEIIYASGVSVRTRRWVWRQSRDALIQPSTTSVFFPIDGFAPTTSGDVASAISALATLAREALGALVETGLVSADHPNFPV